MKLPPVGKIVIVWEGDTAPVEAFGRPGAYQGDGTWYIYPGPGFRHSATVIRGWMEFPSLSQGLPHSDGLMFYVRKEQLNLTEPI